MTTADPWTLLTTIRSTKANFMILVSMDRTGGTIGRRVPMSSTGALFVSLVYVRFRNMHVCTLLRTHSPRKPPQVYNQAFMHATLKSNLPCCDALATRHGLRIFVM